MYACRYKQSLLNKLVKQVPLPESLKMNYEIFPWKYCNVCRARHLHGLVGGGAGGDGGLQLARVANHVAVGEVDANLRRQRCASEAHC